MTYAKMREAYLEANHPEMYQELLTSGQLKAHCREIEQEAIAAKELISDQLLTAQHEAEPASRSRT